MWYTIITHKEVIYMGMTDKQFNAYLRGLRNRLEKAIASKDWSLVEELLEEIRQSMED